jgi:cyclopropane-fatty-acyl-phospholipid synthase
MNPDPITLTLPVAATSRPSMFRGPVLAALSKMRRGRLSLELPGGTVREFGSKEEGPLPLGIPASAEIRITREAFFRKCALYGDIGFAESYIDGDWTTGNLTALVAWFILNIENAPAVSGSGRAKAAGLNLLRLANRLGHALRPNSRGNAGRNIASHYDLSNDFFALFLDESLMYSAALWARPGMTLAEAQAEKNEALCRKLRLKPGDRVLEIGTGWGGWSIAAASKYGCRVTTVTISRSQADLARRRFSDAGLSDRITVELKDYRDIRDRFDKVASIEMIEAVGHRYLPEFCGMLDRVLKPQGLIAMQLITCPDSRYDQFRSGVDFIQKHIFPGSLLISLNRLNALLSRHGGFVLHGMEDLGHDYARTLRAWDERFQARRAAVLGLGFDERFLRKWSYYLGYCEAAFALRNISVVQTVHTRPNNLSL